MVKINWFILFKEITPVYSENHTKPINTHYGKMKLFFIEAGDTYSYQWALKD
jgi:hypothetical protein